MLSPLAMNGFVISLLETLNEVVDSELGMLDPSFKAKFLHIAKMLETLALHKVREPYIKHLEDKLWEIRMEARLGIAWSILLGAIMTNNDVLRRLRYTFNMDDSKVMALFESAGRKVTREQISDWLKKDEDPAYKECHDVELAIFLNGFINDKRGKREGPQPKPERKLNNNLILRKLRIALNLKDEDIMGILTLSGLTIGKPELSAFFRRPDHKNFRYCKNQVLRNFLHGLQLKYRPEKTGKVASRPFKWNDVVDPK